MREVGFRFYFPLFGKIHCGVRTSGIMFAERIAEGKTKVLLEIGDDVLLRLRCMLLIEHPDKQVSLSEYLEEYLNRTLDMYLMELMDKKHNCIMAEVVHLLPQRRIRTVIVPEGSVLPQPRSLRTGTSLLRQDSVTDRSRSGKLMVHGYSVEHKRSGRGRPRPHCRVSAFPR